VARLSVKYFSQPYGLRDAAAWVLHNVAGPSRRYAELTDGVRSGTTANPIRQVLTLAFVGDVLPFRGVAFRVSEELREFLAGADVLIGNFEGTIVEGRPPRVFMGQAHSPQIIEFLTDLFPPERTVLTCANNHAPDYGRALFERSHELLTACGFRAIGGVDAPAALIDGVVALAAGTDWLNRPADYVQGLDPAPPVHADATFRVLCPHWGHELEAFPRPDQVQRANRLLERWDMIVGHHSHCPQPVSLRDGPRARQIVAYSLGNFTFGYNMRHHLHGLVLKVSVGPQWDGAWAAGRVEWRRISIRFERRAAVVYPCPEGLSLNKVGPV
jgi:Bacterial capsule synthesis protein PGA_cap